MGGLHGVRDDYNYSFLIDKPGKNVYTEGKVQRRIR